MVNFQGFTKLTQEHGESLPALLCGILLFLGWWALHLGYLGWALLFLPTAYVIGGYESAKEGLTTLIREQELDVDLLMIVAALGAAGLGLWRGEYYLIIDGAVLILIFAISGALEGYAMRRTEQSIRSLMSLTPDTATVVRGVQEEKLPVNQLEIGDEIIVKPGELIPTDGIVISGYSALNQASITGESLPVEKTIGDEVFGGTLNGFGALKLKVHKSAASSLIQRVIRLVEEAQTQVPPSQQFIEVFERVYAKVIVVLGLLLVVLPPFLWSWSWEVTIYRALTFLVVASPCAMMAAIMPTLLSGIANGARQGVLFKSGAQLETMGKVRAVAFDKTGTLTMGKVEVVEVICAENYAREELLKIAAGLESCSEHPIAQAIVRAAGEDWIRGVNVQALPGQGIRGYVDNQQVLVGNAVFIHQYVEELPDDKLQLWAACCEQRGKTVVWVAQEQVIGAIALADMVRSEAVETISRLRQLGVEQVVMITGDNQRTADSVAQVLGVDCVYAELLPEDKLDVIRQLQAKYDYVAMVGDGINDAPALAQASVGVAMGVAGSDVALETADIVLMADNLQKLASAIELGRRSQLIITQNLVTALGFILLLLVGNFLGDINLPLGVIGHEGSTVLVTVNGLRLLKN